MKEDNERMSWGNDKYEEGLVGWHGNNVQLFEEKENSEKLFH